MSAHEYPIIDSHIHLYAESHLPSLNWTADLSAEHILNHQNSVEQYEQATGSTPNLLGFVFLETDRKFSLAESGWKDSLDEVAFLVRIARGHPIDGEGHTPAQARLVLGIVPWAPLPAGPNALERYVAKVKEICGDEPTFSKIKGFRYLVQDKPEGTMSRPEFISGLQWLGDHDLTFDLGVDLRRGGAHQLVEASEMLKQVFHRGNRLKVIVNHFCKPNLRLSASEVVQHPDFAVWSTCIRSFASYPTTYMKLSGFFSELPPQDISNPIPISTLLGQVKPWVDVVFSSFRPGRIMFGSDWPVCTAGGPGSASWRYWVDLVTAILEDQGLTEQEKQQIWSITAAEAYGIKLVER